MTIARPSQLCVKNSISVGSMPYSAAMSCVREAMQSAIVFDARLIGSVM